MALGKRPPVWCRSFLCSTLVFFSTKRLRFFLSPVSLDETTRRRKLVFSFSNLKLYR
ncbi:hypothetical protein HanIR_Chr01g0020301 [Helianthus annuus]|nr:hypothetical protein HanIR_Chr01g0020301 [Helianthus annuus]